MDWLHHPRFVRERSRAIEALRREEYDFLRIKKVVFLCGAYKSARRDALSQYLKKYVDDALVFFAEDVWATIARLSPSANALQMESQLAGLADMVVVIVESPGTFAEIGAFAISDDLRKKLLPILDELYQTDESFVRTGPVRWVDTDSIFAPSIWTDLDQILLTASEVSSRLGRISRPRPTTVAQAELVASPKHVLFFVCDLVAVFGPCPKEHVDAAILEIFDPVGKSIDVGLYLALGKAMGLIASFVHSGRELYFRRLVEGRLPAFQRKRHIDLPTLRSQVISAMQGCSASADALQELERQT